MDTKSATPIRGLLVPSDVKMTTLRAVRVTHATILNNLGVVRHIGKNDLPVYSLAGVNLDTVESFTCTICFPPKLPESEV